MRDEYSIAEVISAEAGFGSQGIGRKRSTDCEIEPFDLGTAKHPALQGGGTIDQPGILLNSDGSLATGHDITEFNSEQWSIGLQVPGISRRDSTRSIRGLMPNSVEIARDSPSRDMALSLSPSPSLSRRVSA